MNAKACALLLAIAMCALAAPLRAQDGDRFVVGLGIGPYKFTQTDDFRAKMLNLSSKDDAGAAQAYVEWYPWPSVGWGLRYLLIGSEDYAHLYVPPNVEEVHRWVDVHSLLATVQWLPFDPNAYARPGLIAGVGQSRYEARFQFGSSDTTRSSTGIAVLAGAFVDWGAEGFGARFGANSLNTDLDRIETADVDATGFSVYLDLRWSIE